MKLTVYMGALTRMECTKEIEVPDDTTEDDFSRIAREVYDGTDAEEFIEDPTFWERGECWCEKVEE